MKTVLAIGLLLLGVWWAVTSLLCIFGVEREWARAEPSVFNYLARNFMPYTYLALGLAIIGAAPHLLFVRPPDVLVLSGALLSVLAVPIGLLSLIHWPLFLSAPWYRRWYRRGGRRGNNVPLRDPRGSRGSRES